MQNDVQQLTSQVAFFQNKAAQAQNENVEAQTRLSTLQTQMQYKDGKSACLIGNCYASLTTKSLT